MDLSNEINQIITNVEKVILGKTKIIKLALSAMLSEGHILFEDVPGVGKTILARSLARSIGSTFSRIQFTPDLLPSDVTGVSIYNQKTNDFEFKKGPILAQVILADEINRATPRTQSSLLEAMAEKQITVEGISRILPDPFIVMATQNPIEYDGTFPLPEAQVDRFLIRLNIGYPAAEDEVNLLEKQQYQHPIEKIESVIPAEQFVKMQKQIKDIYLTPELREYIVKIVQATRENADLQLGASPRGSLGIFKMSQAWAAIQGRDYVIPDDIKETTPFVLNHRMILKPESKLRGRTINRVLIDLLNQIEVPQE